ATCGDGIVQPQSEECDDGNDANDDGCLNACIAAKCGDGVLRTGVEECDDGNLDPEDGCNDVCWRDRFVFVTDVFYATGLTKVNGADIECRQQAFEHGYTNYDSFKAWLSDSTGTPLSRFVHSQGRYILPSGTVVAEDWVDLVDGLLLHAIDEDGDGGPLVVPVWTNTSIQGSAAGADEDDCEDWTSDDFTLQTIYGVSSEQDSAWTAFDTLDCGSAGALYCFEN
ncbi:MAG: DUF4215 domain-containing protein, partial [Nannocystaceae bacterium]